MSDINKFNETIQAWRDKPAATGSRERKWWCPKHRIIIPTASCPKCLEGVQVVVPTPPASTVTLDRGTFNKVMDALARAARICDLEGFDDADKEMRDALALLRAAEK